MEKKTMGSFLSALRRAEGLTQQEVADRLTVSNRAVSRWERDEAAPDISLLPAIADLYGVTVDELLRGERRRTAEATPAESSETGRTPDASIPSDPRALRGIRALCRREKARFFNLICIAVALSAVGYILFLGITYGYDRPTVACAVLTVFCIGSVVVSLIEVVRMRETLLELSSGEEGPRLSDGELSALVHTFLRGKLAAAFAPIAAALTGCPLVLIRARQSINGVLAGEFYAPLAMAILSAVGLGGWLIGRILWQKDLAQWSDTLGFPPPAPPLHPRPRVLRWLNLWQWGAGSFGFACAEAVNLFFSLRIRPSDPSRAWWFTLGNTLTVLLLVVGLLGTVLPLIHACRHLPRSERKSRVHVLISGIRNLVIILGVATVYLSRVAVVRSEHTVVEVMWAPGALVFFALCASVICLAAEVIRHRMTKE